MQVKSALKQLCVLPLKFVAFCGGRNGSASHSNKELVFRIRGPQDYVELPTWNTSRQYIVKGST